MKLNELYIIIIFVLFKHFLVYVCYHFNACPHVIFRLRYETVLRASVYILRLADSVCPILQIVILKNLLSFSFIIDYL